MVPRKRPLNWSNDGLPIDNPLLDNPLFDNPLLDNPLLDNPLLDNPLLGNPIFDNPNVEVANRKASMLTNDELHTILKSSDQKLILIDGSLSLDNRWIFLDRSSKCHAKTMVTFKTMILIDGTKVACTFNAGQKSTASLKSGLLMLKLSHVPDENKTFRIVKSYNYESKLSYQIHGVKVVKRKQVTFDESPLVIRYQMVPPKKIKWTGYGLPLTDRTKI